MATSAIGPSCRGLSRLEGTESSAAPVDLRENFGCRDLSRLEGTESSFDQVVGVDIQTVAEAHPGLRGLKDSGGACCRGLTRFEGTTRGAAIARHMTLCGILVICLQQT